MEQIMQIDGFIALYIFMLAGFVGHEIIGKVPSKHTIGANNWIHWCFFRCW